MTNRLKFGQNTDLWLQYRNAGINRGFQAPSMPRNLIDFPNHLSQQKVSPFEKMAALTKQNAVSATIQQPDANAEFFFTKTTIRLRARLGVLKEQVEQENIGSLERELNTCNALLEQLYGHADKHKINLRSYFNELHEIESLSERIKYLIESKKIVANNKRRFFDWGRVLDMTIKCVNLIGALFGLPLLPALGAGAGLKLLKSSWD